MWHTIDQYGYIASQGETDMPYDPEKDEMLKQWRCEETGLMLSIQRYNNGEAKLQIGPRILLKKDGSQRAPVKAGRLTIEDVMWLYEIIDDIKDELSALSTPE
jgi:hypothetical protein